MTELQSKPAVMHLTLEITRAETGKTEIVELALTPIEAEPLKEKDHGCNPLDRGA